MCDGVHLWCIVYSTCKVKCVVEEMKTAEIESVLEQLEQQPEVDVDEVVVGPMWCLISE